MRTDELIASLAADNGAVRAPMSRIVFVALAVGGLVSLAVFFSAMGPRADLVAAFSSWRFDLKLAIVCGSLTIAFWQSLRLASPDTPHGVLRASLPIPAALIGAVVLELWLTPSSSWVARLMGTNALVCLTTIPLLSLPPLVAGLVALRVGAPASPIIAGASVGLLAATLAAVLYAFHCFDDSPLFVATWYTLAALPSIVAGAIIGHRMLRW